MQMQMPRLRPRETPTFSKSEIQQMHKTLKEVGEESFNQDFCEKLAKKFSRDTSRAGKLAIQWTQVQDWFQKKYQTWKDKVTHAPLVTPNVEVAPTDASVSNSESENFPDIPKGEKLPGISDMEFEAKSSKDGAWYDVSLFLTHRILSSGEPEVRVRFAGFGAEEDEWVSVKNAVRERSIPLEPSECQKLQVGDLVLCFQESKDQAIYYDAHVVEIKRKLHDIRGCRCLFSIRYEHDNTEETVRLKRLCRRPSS